MRFNIVSLACVGLLTLRIDVHGLIPETPNNALSIPYTVQNGTASSIERYSRQLEASAVEKRQAKGKEKTKNTERKEKAKNTERKGKTKNTERKGKAKNGKIKDNAGKGKEK